MLMAVRVRAGGFGARQGFLCDGDSLSGLQTSRETTQAHHPALPGTDIRHELFGADPRLGCQKDAETADTRK
jgi:hypothetical protein